MSMVVRAYHFVVQAAIASNDNRHYSQRDDAAILDQLILRDGGIEKQIHRVEDSR
jgi:hypothetical protein